MVDGSLLQGRYRLKRRMASGGMGSVFEATDERLNRRVAVKLLKDELANDPRFVERFRREARAVASLSHPNIANVYDYAEEDGKHFIVMEFADGRDLAHILSERAPLVNPLVTHLGAQLCQALAHAHAVGIIHRDVKPANVIVDKEDRVKVTDFGIARAAGESSLTATGSILGTAHYLSPEQARGTSLTPASDIYSAGIVIFEMLTGSVPFTGGSAIAVAMRHMNENVPPPSSLNPAVTPDLDAIVARATAKAPADRYRSAEDMADAFRHRPAPVQPVAAAVPAPPPTQTVWPIPGDGYDPRRTGRAIVLVLLALGLMVGALIAYRVLSDDDGGSRGPGPSNGGGGSNQGSGSGDGDTSTPPSPSPSPADSPTGILISDSFIGANSDEVEQLLTAQGVSVDTTPQDSEEPAGTVLATEPPPGTTVEAGDTVTLIVSTGTTGDEGDEAGDDD